MPKRSSLGDPLAATSECRSVRQIGAQLRRDVVAHGPVGPQALFAQSEFSEREAREAIEADWSREVGENRVSMSKAAADSIDTYLCPECASLANLPYAFGPPVPSRGSSYAETL